MEMYVTLCSSNSCHSFPQSPFHSKLPCPLDILQKASGGGGGGWEHREVSTCNMMQESRHTDGLHPSSLWVLTAGAECSSRSEFQFRAIRSYQIVWQVRLSGEHLYLGVTLM